MKNYNEELIDHLYDTLKVLCETKTIFILLSLLLPTILIFHINSLFIFTTYFITSCMFSKSAKLGGLIGVYIVWLTLILYYNSPEPGHYIELILRGSPRGNSVTEHIKNSKEIIDTIPKGFQAKLLVSFFQGVFYGGFIGLGLGMTGRILKRQK
ncbi:hypothetical protein L1D29_18735 [Shewanella insulae]|uniref:hypothetical protein n=1 Tax=Shewanella insulae TaxID=2681496 RepID=UPI001EFEBA31|nr:hypothetical protein [Shewanella insulae]MCG9714843.1 hypothetical protein [Shewanella insulae]